MLSIFYDGFQSEHMNGKICQTEDLIDLLKKHDLKLESLDGMKFNILNNEWRLSSDKSINYIGKFIKN